MEKIKKILQWLNNSKNQDLLKRNQSERIRFENSIMEDIFKNAKILNGIFNRKDLSCFFPSVFQFLNRMKDVDTVSRVLSNKDIEWYYDFDDDVSFLYNGNVYTIKLSLTGSMYKYTVKKGITTYTGDDFPEILNRLINNSNDDDEIEAVMEDDYYATHKNAIA